MLYEYAVEPACLGDWQTFRYLIEQFGVSQGRLISRFPKDWAKKVYDSIGSGSVRHRFQMEIMLKQIQKNALVPSGREYNGALSWLTNACAQHETKPFRAIIVKEVTSPPAEQILTAEDINQNEPLWAVAREGKVARTVNDLGNAVAPLLRISERIMFVDKMFNPYSRTEFNRWLETLEQFIRLSTQDREKLPTFDYHCGIENEEFGKPEEQRKREFQEICEQCITKILPPGVSITITRWDQHHGGDFFHDRYILSEKGGIRIGWGLDRSKRPQESTDVTLLDNNLWAECWPCFQVGASTYRFIDSTVVRKPL